MSIATPGVLPASVLVRNSKPDWLRDWARFAAAKRFADRIGTTEDPYGPEDVAAKFHELADPVWGAPAATRLREAVSGLRDAASTVELDRLLITELTP